MKNLLHAVAVKSVKIGLQLHIVFFFVALANAVQPTILDTAGGGEFKPIFSPPILGEPLAVNSCGKLLAPSEINCFGTIVHGVQIMGVRHGTASSDHG